MSNLIVTGKAMRPASDICECFYCQQSIGEPHKEGCVLIKKKAKVRMTVEYDIEIPARWAKEDIEFHRNEGSWCSDNAIEELKGLVDKKGCLCPITHFECVELGSDIYLDE